MAAYDWGPGKVQRAVQRTGYADFWQLYERNVLPAETKNYVPIIVAAAIMAKNPTQYGLEDIPADPPLISDTVTTNSHISLNLVADLAGTTADEIQQLNPALLRNSTPEDMTYNLHLPPGTGTLFQQRLAMIPEEHRGSWRFHIAGQEDTVDSIAQMFHVKASNLLTVNQLQSEHSIHTGEALVVPVAPPPVASAHMRYRARRGDTMITVADRFGVTTGQLRRWNGIRSNHLSIGRLLYVSEPVRSHHRSSRVRRGYSSASARPASTTHSRSVRRSKSHRTSVSRSIAAKHGTRRRRKSAG